MGNWTGVGNCLVYPTCGVQSAENADGDLSARLPNLPKVCKYLQLYLHCPLPLYRAFRLSIEWHLLPRNQIQKFVIALHHAGIVKTGTLL
jgi:hypothetical protein